MAEAEVGDDVFGEDPTVRRLEEEAAAAMAKEAAVFVPSGTMGNQIALHLHARSGDEILVESSSHVLHYEMGALAALSGAQVKPLPSKHGLLDPAVVEAAIVRDVPYQSRSAALVVVGIIIVVISILSGTPIPLILVGVGSIALGAILEAWVRRGRT